MSASALPLPPTFNESYDQSFVLRSQNTYGRDFAEPLSRPDDVFWSLCRVLETLLFVAERHNIPMWAEYGTLLGLKRDGSPILWDYDGDVGILDKDRITLLEAVQKDQKAGLCPEDFVMDEQYYQDRGCMACYFRDHRNEICDIIFYEERDGMVASLQSEKILTEYPCAYNYSLPVEDVFPLEPTIMLGHRIYTWKNWQRPLDLVYGDWRTPLKDKSSWIVFDFHGPCVVPVPVHDNVDTFQQFRELKEKSKVPLILRKTALLETTEERYRQAVKFQKRPVFGYTDSTTWEPQNEAVDVFWTEYLEHRLRFNVVDAPCDDLDVMPKEWTEYAHKMLGKDFDDSALCWVLTNAPCVSHWHTDHMYNGPGQGNPGGWMKVQKGRKIWWALPQEHLNHLISKGHPYGSLAKLSLSEMLQLENSYAWGKILYGEVSDGDIFWFPPECLHKVITLEDTYGFGGYV